MTNNPSSMVLEGFDDFLEQNPGSAKGLLRTTQGKVATKGKWVSLALTLNAFGGAIKDVQGWAKYGHHPSRSQATCQDLSVGRSVDTDMERVASMEARRVEAELTSAQAVNKLAEAAMSITDAIRKKARNMP